MDEFWVDDLDLSTLTPEQFSTFFFDRPIFEGVDAKYKLFLGEFCHIPIQSGSLRGERSGDVPKFWRFGEDLLA